MSQWTEEELERIGAAEELQLASVQRDGALRQPVTIWVVRVGDALYVRSYRGRDSAWYRGVQVRHEGRIEAGGVVVEERDPAINAQVDAAYRAKYRRYPQYVAPLLTDDARVTTLRLAPR
ncbi:MAG: hypothetical protein BWY25_01679 [Chloroflexi bacterium ADurb.Bin222]|nr:MAG: hypothetical protein BWY25_01679 [Chloroflexi bacterium ADurb.Bin222]